MITRKVDRNDSKTGFIYYWVKKLAGQVEKLVVISWQEGDSYGLPNNVEVIFLKTNQNKLLKIGSFKKAVWKNIKNVDGVFCHQMPIYTIMAAPFAKLYGKKVVSWYTHKQVDFKMKLMTWLADVVLTASAESFRLKSNKVRVVGHGIDVDFFKPAFEKVNSDIFKIISVGRISPTKDLESMIKAVQMLVEQGIRVDLEIVGQVGLVEHESYLKVLQEMVVNFKLQGQIKFTLGLAPVDIPAKLQQVDLLINLSGTGSLDKAVLEAMACECLVLSGNEAFNKILPEALQTKRNDPEQLAIGIKAIIGLPIGEKKELASSLRGQIVNNHNLDNLVKKIVKQFS